MGRMSELMIETMQVEAAWPGFIAQLIEETGLGTASVKDFDGIESQEDYEFSLTFPDVTFYPTAADQRVAVEIKVYRWRKDWVSHFRQAIDHLTRLMKSSDFSGGILVVTLDLEHTTEKNLFPDDSFPAEIWDISRLRRLVQGNAKLENTLEELIAETLLDDVAFGWPVTPPPLRAPIPPDVTIGIGSSISAKLKATQEGKKGWTEYENCCEEALKCLFGDDIKAWRAQNRTSDKLARMDLIGRINVGTNSFWSVVERDFNTRYVVFEAKNYSRPIKQGEVFTTEKYLFTKALRSVAIIIARNGCDAGAQQAMMGALREQGKLILLLTMEELCIMLERFDQGDAPENTLYQKMDELLMGVGR